MEQLTSDNLTVDLVKQTLKATGQNAKEGKIKFKVLTPPQLTAKKGKRKTGEEYDNTRYEMRIRFATDKAGKNIEEKVWRMNPTTSDYLVKQFGSIPKTWVAKEGFLKLEDTQVGIAIMAVGAKKSQLEDD